MCRGLSEVKTPRSRSRASLADYDSSVTAERAKGECLPDAAE
jgi:hypothetical protein